MTKVVVGEDCGNAPKKLFLRDFNIVFAKGDTETILDSVIDDVEWNMVGGDHIKGKEEFARVLDEMKGEPASELVIDNIITHGNTAAANGTIKFGNGKTYAFCDIYRFSGFKNAKIKSITAYVMAI